MTVERMTESDMTTEHTATPPESELSSELPQEQAPEAIAAETADVDLAGANPGEFGSDGSGSENLVDDLDVPAEFDALDIESEPEVAPPEPGTVSLAAVLDSVKQELDSLKAQLEDRNSQYVRIAADFENFRNRTQREKQEQETRVRATTLRDLLPVVDNFERARAQLNPQGEEAIQIHKSYQGIYKQLVDGLKRLGVAPMRAEGKEFDPNLHEAVLREPTTDYDEGIVMEELQRGYLLDEMVLRHAMVKVAASPDPGMEAGQSSEG